ncbi:uncharacterized protein LOC134211764 isoform X2 [Armigeres subalbatus]|uniref:uncharacterized protein LOC134211764 isoform X2 n=1 Tax=Armigeres subalbatus TaxID=124917 RepID=UPI002ED03320
MVCPMGKHCRQPFSKKGSRAAEVLDVIHTDICGPMEVDSIGGSKYYIAFIDDKSRKMWVYFLKTKAEPEILRIFKEFHAMVERQSERKIKAIRSDKGMEYLNEGFENYLKIHGIRHQKTNVYTPQQNGMAERANRSIVERARCLLFEGRMKKSFWAEAVNTSVYLLNRSPTQGHECTPEQGWTGKKPDLSHLRIFGTKAMAQVPKQRRLKLDPKSREAVFVGYDENTKGYRLYDPQSQKVFISREVWFIDEGVSSAVVNTKRLNMIVLDYDFVTTKAAASGSDNCLSENEDDDEEFYTDCENDSIADEVLMP